MQEKLLRKNGKPLSDIRLEKCKLQSACINTNSLQRQIKRYKNESYMRTQIRNDIHRLFNPDPLGGELSKVPRVLEQVVCAEIRAALADCAT